MFAKCCTFFGNKYSATPKKALIAFMTQLFDLSVVRAVTKNLKHKKTREKYKKMFAV